MIGAAYMIPSEAWRFIPFIYLSRYFG